MTLSRRHAAVPALVLALALAGCTASPSEGTVKPASTPTESATPLPAPGSSVDASVATAMNGDAGGERRAYPMPDGTYIVVDSESPLPDAVQQDVNAKGAAHTAAFPMGTTTSDETDARKALITEVATATGRQPILIMHLGGYNDAGDVEYRYFFNGAYNSNAFYYTLDEAVADVNAELASRPNPHEYVVIYPG